MNNKKQKTISLESLGGLVFSTNKELKISTEKTDEVSLENSKQQLRVELDKKNRGGKIVTLITGFVGSEMDLNELAKYLKNKCGVGGASKDGEIIIQGAMLDKVYKLLLEKGYKVKLIK
jgi:translation initiation factor 1